MKKRVGDTLIEVTLAVGIFSMVAVAVVSVISGTTSSAQGALEITLTREQIDTQAEALRFVQSSYLAGGSKAEGNPYKELWDLIKGKAIVPDGKNIETNPKSCTDIFEGNVFVLNPRKLGVSGNVAFIDSGFKEAATYPRLVYGGESDALNNNGAVLKDISKVEGISVLGVADASGTVMVGDGELMYKASGYFDFYIRSCWYTPGADTPSTISTVIRLYDPDAVGTSLGAASMNTKIFHNNEGGGADYTQYIREGGTPTQPQRPGYVFGGWFSNPDGSGEQWVEGSTDGNTSKEYYARWIEINYTITYNANGGSYAPSNTYCKGTERCVLSSGEPSRSGYRFEGWERRDAEGTGSVYLPGAEIRPYEINDGTESEMLLYAKWAQQNDTITILTQWTGGSDYDSYLQLQKPDSDAFVSATYGTSNINVTYDGKTYSLITGAGDGRGSHNGKYYEKFTINTLGGKNYYYSIRNWSSPGTINSDITITVSGQYLEKKVFKSTSRSNCQYWNVFAIKDGRIVNNNTCTSSMSYGY